MLPTSCILWNTKAPITPDENIQRYADNLWLWGYRHGSPEPHQYFGHILQ